MIYLGLAILCIVFTGASQILLKLGARGKVKNYQLFLNPYTLMGYGLLVLVTVCAVLALRGLELKTLYAIMSFNYVFVTLLSYLFLKEELRLNKLIAALLIFTGIIVFNM